MGNIMKNYLINYIQESEIKLKSKITKDDIENHLNKISFFSHERLIHLIVTMFFALFTIIFIYITINNNSLLFLLITIILLIILLFYIVHYYYLENGVQELYRIYDKMKEKVK